MAISGFFRQKVVQGAVRTNLRTDNQTVCFMLLIIFLITYIYLRF